VTTFVKAEEQNYSLYNYVNRLNQETDALEENNKRLNNDIKDYEHNVHQSQSKRDESIEGFKKSI